MMDYYGHNPNFSWLTDNAQQKIIPSNDNLQFYSQNTVTVTENYLFLDMQIKDFCIEET